MLSFLPLRLRHKQNIKHEKTCYVSFHFVYNSLRNSNTLQKDLSVTVPYLQLQVQSYFLKSYRLPSLLLLHIPCFQEQKYSCLFLIFSAKIFVNNHIIYSYITYILIPAFVYLLIFYSNSINAI